MHREFLSILPVRYFLNCKPGKDEDLLPGGKKPSIDSDLFGRTMRINVHRVEFYLPSAALRSGGGRAVQLNFLALAIPRAGRQQRA